MDSKMFLKEKVNNEDRKFGSTKEYFPCRIEDEEGNIINALFTEDQIATAVQRALRNPEDIPEKTIWESIFG